MTMVENGINRLDIIESILSELDRAYAKHGNDKWGRHEFWGIFQEEVNEVIDAIQRDLPHEDLMKEIFQVACVCIRYAETGDRYRSAKKTQEFSFENINPFAWPRTLLFDTVIDTGTELAPRINASVDGPIQVMSKSVLGENTFRWATDTLLQMKQESEFERMFGYEYPRKNYSPA